jgi:hypothetical protein
MSVLALIGSMGLVACSDEPEVVSQQQYDDEAARLCERLGAELVPVEAIEARPASDAAKAAFLAGEMVPAARAIVRSLDGFGYPASKAVAYSGAAVDAFEALAALQADAIRLLDLRRQGLLVADDDPFADLDEALSTMDIPCWTG